MECNHSRNNCLKYYTIKSIKIIANILFYSFAIFVIITFIVSKVNPTSQAKYLGFEMRVITTNSMQGTIDKGTMIVSTRVEPKDIKVGDIITYKTGYYTRDKSDYIITHRVIEISPIIEDNITGESSYYFQTRGDNNPDKDPYLVHQDDVISRYSFSVPITKVIVNSIIPALHTPQGIFFAAVLVISVVGGITCLHIMTKTFMEEYKKRRKGSASDELEDKPFSDETSDPDSSISDNDIEENYDDSTDDYIDYTDSD